MAAPKTETLKLFTSVTTANKKCSKTLSLPRSKNLGSSTPHPFTHNQRRLLMNIPNEARPGLYFLAIFILLFTAICTIAGPDWALAGSGILPAKSGKAVLICGESITINHTSPEQMKKDFDETLGLLNQCPK